MGSGRLRRAGLALPLALAIVGCAPVASPSPTSDPVRELADQLGKADVVAEVSVMYDFGDDPTIDVDLRAGAGIAQAQDLVCRVVEPAIQSGRIPMPLARDLSVIFWDSTGRELAVESDCG